MFNHYRSLFTHSLTGIILIFLASCTDAPTPIKNIINGKSTIEEEAYISIGGIEQWVTIKGDNKNNPVILFIHGGPGSPLSPYADTIYKAWKKDFVLVHWDQRGSGRTYGRNAPKKPDPNFIKANPLQLEQMTDDGIELAQFLTKKLKTKKIILFGESWGSVLAVQMARKNPELFHAYFGLSQIVNPIEDFNYTYEKMLRLTSEAQDRESIDILDFIGPPPYKSAMTAGKLYRVIKKYERKTSAPAPEVWWDPAPQYDNPTDSRHRFEGDDYSFFNFIGDEKTGITGMNASINLQETDYEFKIPVLLFQGEADILTPKEISRKYFDKITAPTKKYFTISGTGHGISPDVLNMQSRVLKGVLAGRI